MELEKYMTSYRYLIVIAGLVSADRLNTFLSHSGAVILLQETDFVYHYSSLLKPWVHYGELIPDSFNYCVLIVF
jgi:Glycosyl transferase family 90